MWTKTRARDERCSKYIISLCCYHALSCALTGRVVKGVPSPGLNPLVPSGRRTIPNCLNFAPFNPGLSYHAPSGRRDLVPNGQNATSRTKLTKVTTRVEAQIAKNSKFLIFESRLRVRYVFVVKWIVSVPSFLSPRPRGIGHANDFTGRPKKN